MSFWKPGLGLKAILLFALVPHAPRTFTVLHLIPLLLDIFKWSSLPSLPLSKHHSGLCLGLELSSSHVMGQVDSGLAPGMVWNLLSLVPWSTRLEAIYSVPDGVHEALTVCTIDPCCVL